MQDDAIENEIRTMNVDTKKFENETYLCDYTVKMGKLDCLKYAREQGCHLNINICYHAAKNGRLYCLQYAHEQEFSWNTWICISTSQNGHLKCLKYAHEQGCPCYSNTCNSPILVQHSGVLCRPQE